MRFHSLFQSIQDIQISLRDGFVVLKSMNEDLRRNVTSERTDINTLFKKLYQTMRQEYEGTLRTIDE